MYEVRFSKTFKKSVQKILSVKSLKEKVEHVVLILQKGKPFPKKLRVHSLRGIYTGYYSANVTGDWRIIFDLQEKELVIICIDLGTHSQLY